MPLEGRGKKKELAGNTSPYLLLFFILGGAEAAHIPGTAERRRNGAHPQYKQWHSGAAAPRPHRDRFRYVRFPNVYVIKRAVVIYHFKILVSLLLPQDQDLSYSLSISINSK